MTSRPTSKKRKLAEPLPVDFSQIPGGYVFEAFVSSLLKKLGWEVLREPGVGTDKGIDLVVRSPAEPHTGLSRTFVVQCKHMPRGVVGQKHMPRAVDRVVAAAKADGFLLVSSGDVSQNIRDLSQTAGASATAFVVWDAQALVTHLLESRASDLVRRFMPASAPSFAMALVNRIPVSWTDAIASLAATAKADIHRVIGLKYIPGLYVTRHAIEDELDNLLAIGATRRAVEESVAFARQELIHFRDRVRDAEMLLLQRVFPTLAREVPQFGRSSEWQTIIAVIADLTALLADRDRSPHSLSLAGIEELGKLPEALDVLSTSPTRADLQARARVADTWVERARSGLLTISSSLDLLGQVLPRTTRSGPFQGPDIGTQHLAASDSARDAVELSLKIVASCVRSADDVAGVVQRAVAGIQPIVAIVERAGRGKTNLVCDVVRRYADHCPVIFVAAKSLRRQPGALLQYVQERASMATGVNDDPIGRLAIEAFAQGQSVLIAVDGVNEHIEPFSFEEDIEQFAASLRHLNIRLLLTCRQEYWPLFERLTPLSSRQLHDVLQSFSDAEAERARELYFDYFDIHLNCDGEVKLALRDPLLLRFFCEAYQGVASQPPRRFERLRLAELFDEYRRRKHAHIAAALRRERAEAVDKYVEGLADLLLETGATTISRQKVEAALGYPSIFERDSLYSRLLDEDIIIEQRIDAARGEVLLSFTYEAFLEDVLGRMLAREYSPTELLDGFVGKWLARHRAFPNAIGVLGFFATHVINASLLSLTEVADGLRSAMRSDAIGSLLITLDNIAESAREPSALVDILNLAVEPESSIRFASDAVRILESCSIDHDFQTAEFARLVRRIWSIEHLASDRRDTLLRRSLDMLPGLAWLPIMRDLNLDDQPTVRQIRRWNGSVSAEAVEMDAQSSADARSVLARLERLLPRDGGPGGPREQELAKFARTIAEWVPREGSLSA